MEKEEKLHLNREEIRIRTKMSKVEIGEAFELFHKGKYLELASLNLEEHVDIFSGKVDYYNLRIKLLGHDNKFLEEELSSETS